MEDSRREERNWAGTAVLLPVLLAALVYLFSASPRAVIDYDEGHYCQAPLRMIQSGDWVTPYVNGVRFLEKPPLMYWLTAISLRVFGVNEFALRFPTALAVVLLVWVVALLASRAAGARAAVIAGLSISFSVGTYLFTRETLHDIWLVLFVALAMVAFFEWHLDPGHSVRPAMLFYAAVAGAVMCKSLVGLAFPVGIVAAFFLFSRRRPPWRRLYLLPGSALFLALTVPWHWMAAVRNPGFLWYFFGNEQFLRFLGRHDPPVLWSLPLLAFWALIPVWFFPWTAFLPAAVAAARKPVDDKTRALVTLTLAWLVVILGFFSISGRLEHYSFPVLPAMSLLVGMTLGAQGEGKSVKWAFRGLAILGIVILAGGIGAGIWLSASGYAFREPVGRPGIVYETDFSILADMPSSIFRELVKPAAITIVTLALGFLAAHWFESRRRRMQAVASIAAAMLVVFGMVHWSLNLCEDLISSKKFGQAIAREARPGDRVVVVGDYESANSLNFYEPLRVEVFGGTAYALIPGMKYADAPRIVLSLHEFQAAWQSDVRVFAIVPRSQLGQMRLSGTQMLRVLDRTLMCNRPSTLRPLFQAQ